MPVLGHTGPSVPEDLIPNHILTPHDFGYSPSYVYGAFGWYAWYWLWEPTQSGNISIDTFDSHLTESQDQPFGLYAGLGLLDLVEGTQDPTQMDALGQRFRQSYTVVAGHRYYISGFALLASGDISDPDAVLVPDYPVTLILRLSDYGEAPGPQPLWAIGGDPSTPPARSISQLPSRRVFRPR